MEDPVLSHSNQNEIVCTCGAKLTYKPGTDSLVCEYCGQTHNFEVKKEAIEEIDFLDFLKNKGNQAPQTEVVTIKCNACGAATTFEENVVSSDCAFCGAPLVAENKQSNNLIQPKSLLPFKIDKRVASEEYRKWIAKLWFAPNKLKKYARQSKIYGMYIPYWTYDSDTYTKYNGERGIDYQETETYTDSDGTEQKRTVTKTRWTYVSGSVSEYFDDVLVVASKSLPVKYMDKLEPWDLENLVPYDSKYLTGFRAESYQVDLEAGFEVAQNKMEVVIRSAIRDDIGGDRQRIHSMDTKYNDISFKHLLLPVWISSYRYSNKIYRFMVNARTGEVQGERPYSWIKITLAVLVVLIIIAVIYYFAEYRG